MASLSMDQVLVYVSLVMASIVALSVLFRDQIIKYWGPVGIQSSVFAFFVIFIAFSIITGFSTQFQQGKSLTINNLLLVGIIIASIYALYTLYPKLIPAGVDSASIISTTKNVASIFGLT